MEKKSELYEHLSDGAGNSQLAGRFLVDFKTKKQQEITVQAVNPILEGKPDDPTEDEENNDEDSEWYFLYKKFNLLLMNDGDKSRSVAIS